MMRNNVKIMSATELELLNERYLFTYEDGMVVVRIKGYDRLTTHPRDKTFSINSKIRKVTFNPDIINKWIELYNSGEEYSLFDVAQAVNKLYLMYQPDDMEHLKKMLERETIRIKKA